MNSLNSLDNTLKNDVPPVIIKLLFLFGMLDSQKQVFVLKWNVRAGIVILFTWVNHKEEQTCYKVK